MTEWILGADMSHYQQRPDFDRLVDDGVRFVIIKATERTSVDPDFDWNRTQALKRNMPWMAYPFLRPEDGDAAINRFCTVVGRGGVAALDWEASGVTARAVETWMDGCHDGLGRDGIGYRGKWPPAPPTARIMWWPWWYAQYPSDPDAAPRVPVWDATHTPDWSRECLIWQYTGAGRLPGVTPQIDLNRLACPWDVFMHWYQTGAAVGPIFADQPPPAPPIVVEHAVTRNLCLHASGGDVLALQRRLNSQASAGLVEDGEFGGATLRAVVAYQQAQALGADGIVGALTRASLGL